MQKIYRVTRPVPEHLIYIHLEGYLIRYDGPYSLPVLELEGREIVFWPQEIEWVG